MFVGRVGFPNVDVNHLKHLSDGAGSGLGLKHILMLAGLALRSLSVILTVIDIHPAPTV